MSGAATIFDAVIVGAGPAGSTVAIQLARAGWSVALIEKQRFPRRKVCGECVAASNLQLLHDLGIGEAFDVNAGPALRRVTLLRGDNVAAACLPAAEHDRFPWGRALGREILDGLLLDQARAAGASVFQPCAVQAILGGVGAWHCELRALDAPALHRLHARVMIDAHGSWEALPSERPNRRLARHSSDLFAFKANFKGSALAEGEISVLALDGGYGGMVQAGGGTMTVACCIRRDRLSELRSAALGQCVGDVVETWLQRECAGVRKALEGALRDGPWLSSGPLAPGIRVDAQDTIFKVGNAAGEAHPILGEGMSMALQSAALLSAHLLGTAPKQPQYAINASHRAQHSKAAPSASVPDAAMQAMLHRCYAAAWRKAFAPRLCVAAAFAHLAMRPFASVALVKLAQAWPGLLTHGARWGGKVRLASVAGTAATALPARESIPPNSDLLESRPKKPQTPASSAPSER